MTPLSRRQVLRGAGGLAVAGTVAIAGCSSSCPDSGHPTPDVIRSIDADPVGAFGTTPTGTWPSYHGDAGNTGYVDANPPFDDVALRWQADLSLPSVDDDDRSASPPVVGDRHVYVADADRVHALEARTGEMVWQSPSIEPTVRDTFDEYRPTTAPPTIGPEGSVYVGTVDGLVALSAVDGSVQWRSTAVTAASSPTVNHGAVYAAGTSGVIALDADNGRTRWTSSVPTGETIDPPAVGADIVVESGSRKASGIDPRTGDRRWQVDQAESHPVVDDDTCYVGTDGALVAAAVNSGEERWRFSRGDYRAMRSPVVTPETIYLVEHPPEAGSATFALNREENSPKPRWCSDVGSGVVTAATDDRAFVLLPIGEGPTSQTGIASFTADLGAVPWALRGGRIGQGEILPPAVLDDAIVATTRTGTVLALGDRPATNGGA
ncbi:MAG: outer membrane protein assembly factor BamB [Halobacteriales archaeon]|jgi:outer membrane protein assembly factor BamB